MAALLAEELAKVEGIRLSRPTEANGVLQLSRQV